MPDLVEHLLGNRERAVRRRDAAVDRAVKQYLLISSGVRPIRRAARTCIASSSSRPRATSAASVMQLLVLRSSPGRAQISPHAYRVMRSWKSSVKLVVRSTARSTCSSPSTSRAHLQSASSAAAIVSFGHVASLVPAGSSRCPRSVRLRGQAARRSRDARPRRIVTVAPGIESAMSAAS